MELNGRKRDRQEQREMVSYPLREGGKPAVGTSVFIMTFTALTGAVSHFAIGGGVTDYSILALCIIFTLIGAMLTARFANKASAKVMNRTLGFGLAAMSIIMIIVNYV